MLGIESDYTYFDPDIIMHINSAFMVLRQLGVGPVDGFAIEDKDAEWTDFVSDTIKIEAIKSYVYMKVRLMFDPPVGSSTMEAMKNNIAELEWRLNVAVDGGEC